MTIPAPREIFPLDILAVGDAFEAAGRTRESGFELYREYRYNEIYEYLESIQSPVLEKQREKYNTVVKDGRIYIRRYETAARDDTRAREMIDTRMAALHDEIRGGTHDWYQAGVGINFFIDHDDVEQERLFSQDDTYLFAPVVKASIAIDEVSFHVDVRDALERGFANPASPYIEFWNQCRDIVKEGINEHPAVPGHALCLRPGDLHCLGLNERISQLYLVKVGRLKPAGFTGGTVIIQSRPASFKWEIE